MVGPGLVQRWRCVCPLLLVHQRKVGLLSKRSMTSGMPSRAVRSFACEKLQRSFFQPAATLSGESGHAPAVPLFTLLARYSFFQRSSARPAAHVNDDPLGTFEF